VARIPSKIGMIQFFIELKGEIALIFRYFYPLDCNSLVILVVNRRPIRLWLFRNYFPFTLDQLANFVFNHEVARVSRMSDILERFSCLLAGLFK
jgi:hypothetical protein